MTAPEKLKRHIEQLMSCRLCPHMTPPVVSGGPIFSKIILIGQAPGDKEPKLGRPFAWTAGKTLFGWFHDVSGLTENQIRNKIYFAAVCRCFPGKKTAGGDRVPDKSEIENCSLWLKKEIEILRPSLLIPVGKLAISQFLPPEKLHMVIGRQFRSGLKGICSDIIPLPHPSGASPWHRQEPGKSLLKKAMNLIVKHPAF